LTDTTEDHGYKEVIKNYPHNVKSLLTSGIEEVDASWIAGRRLMPPTATPKKSPAGKINKYPVAAAKQYINALCEAGLGHATVVGRSTKFAKRKFEDLDVSVKVNLANIQVSEANYSKKAK
jgi:hypothetical protein